MARTSDNSTIPTLGVYAQAGAPTFSADLTEVADDVASVIASTVATVVDLPTAGNWVNRVITVEDLDEPFYWNGAAWVELNPAMTLVQAQSATSSVNGTVLLVWSAPTLDTGPFFNAAQTTRMYIPRSGVYRIDYTARIGGVNPITTALRVSGTPLTYAAAGAVGASGAASTAASSQIVRMVAGDFVDIQLISTAVASGAHQLNLQRLGA